MEERKKTNSETTGFFSFLNIFLYHVFFFMTNFPSVCVCARQAETLRPFRAPPILNIKFPSPPPTKTGGFQFLLKKNVKNELCFLSGKKGNRLQTDNTQKNQDLLALYFSWLFINSLSSVYSLLWVCYFSDFIF